MKLTFLGTSHGVPEPARRCSCTMIEVAGRYYFVDMGTQAIEDLIRRGIAIEDVKGIFITHPHGDHTNGLISFVDLINWYFKTADPTLLLPEQEQIDALNAWLRAAGTEPRPLKFGVLAEGVCYDDGFLKVTAIRTQHCRTSYAFLVEAEGKKVLFTGDLRNPSVDFPKAAFEQELDLIIVESAHFSPAITEKVLQNAKVRRVLHNHVSPRWNGDLHQMAQNEHPYRYGMAFDGMEITL
ncbi:MAG: MBL fold metallo-hydrolase [Eubacteriales bacterium]